jgi:putative FmdB family regulatory protein
MPTYQYACTNPECTHRFELVQAFTDPAASECPVCGSPVRKVYGSVGVVFKGSGFYRNDSRAASVTSESGAKESTPAKEPAKAGAKESSGSSSGSSGSDSSSSGSSNSGSSGSGSSGSNGSAAKSGSGSGASGKTAASA